ncbi:MAG: aminotransferase class V-fold PLP-dependent enzyme [Flavobacteriales bacterium]|nr:aminotransferase class V-fold PLP-dependent enzyme [Flavobacteriales bacterium]
MDKLSRKDFLKRSLMASAALPFVPSLSGCEAKPLVVPEGDDLIGDEDFWSEVRQHYLLDEKVINLNNGSVGPQPLSVQDSHIDMYRLSNKAPAHYMWHELNDKREPLREALANLMDAESEEVAINRNTTEGLNTVIFGLNLREGDEVVVSDFDYPFMLNAWRQRQMRDGIILKEVKLPLPIEDVSLAVELYEKAITPKTKVVHITHVINWTGQVMPVKEITAMAKAKGCEVVVDSAHALAHVPLSFKEIGCDYLATSLHKWLGAPFGTGALVVKKEKKAALWPLMSPYEPQSDDIRKFEFLGTRSIPAEMAALDAIAFHQKLGAENVHKRLHFIKNYWAERVKDLEGLTLHTSLKPEFGGAMATISIDGLTAGDIATALRKSANFDVGFIVWNGMDAVRISPHIYTSLDELDRLVVSVKKLAGK